MKQSSGELRREAAKACLRAELRHDLDLVGWAKRSVPTLLCPYRTVGGHGATRLCLPYGTAAGMCTGASQ